MKHIFYILLLAIIMNSCTKNKAVYNSYDEYPTSINTDLWLNYTKEATVFKIWSPTAEEVKLNLYKDGFKGEAFETHNLKLQSEGIWSIKLKGDYNGIYYTYQILNDGKWLDETPGIYATAVGVNGMRAMVLDLESTNPHNWDTDEGPDIPFPNQAIVYELHIRDLTIHPESGSTFAGKYLGLVEKGTTGPMRISTALDHIKELGITHVHLLPTFDHYSIDESNLDSAQFNWGYDPQNYNVPEGSYSSDPYNAEVRIKEFKQMVKTFHENGIGVILDVVYNHTGRTEKSNFNLELPGYYYRHLEDGSYSNSSACGNETASERLMVRKFIVESILFWAKEYHLDGFRFDLMGIHDIATMNEITKQVKKINSQLFIYGEGWTAGDSPLPYNQRALKAHTTQMPLIAAFSDDIRDALKGSVFDDLSTGFVSGAKSTEESIKFGVVGSVYHPQINYEMVNYSKEPWATHPWQSVSYVSCHDNHTIFDKLKVSCGDASLQDIIKMDKLATSIVMTSQGMAFIHAGSELLRTKNNEHNSYNLPDEINQIDWNWKIKNANVFEYYKNLIHLRKNHPAFWMNSAEDIKSHLEFKRVEFGLVSYVLKDNANGDNWKNIYVIYNAQNNPVNFELEGDWNIALRGNKFDFDGLQTISNSIEIPPISMMVLFQK